MADLRAGQSSAGGPYLEFLRGESMSAGLYVLAAGAVDGQQPHTEDEIYVVVRGQARFTAGEVAIEVGDGDVIFVPAGESHRFHDIAEELALVVLFAPAEGTRSSDDP